jgi:cytoskeleton protein RodZ
MEENMGIGEALRRARLEKGISLEQIETDTKIQRRYLEAMENEQWDVLPGQVYLKSFFKIYSRYLGLSEHFYYQLMNQHSFRSGPKHHTPKFKLKISPQVKTTIVLAIAAIVLLLSTSYFYQQYLALPDLPEVAEHGLDPNAEEPLEPSLIDPEEEISPEEGSGEEEPLEPEENPESIEAMTLALKCVNSPCWVRVTDGNNNKLYEGTMAVDQELELPNLQRFTLRLGNAGSMQARINGKDLGRLGHMVVTKTYYLENNEIKELGDTTESEPAQTTPAQQQPSQQQKPAQQQPAQEPEPAGQQPPSQQQPTQQQPTQQQPTQQQPIQQQPQQPSPEQPQPPQQQQPAQQTPPEQEPQPPQQPPQSTTEPNSAGSEQTPPNEPPQENGNN